MASNTPKNVRDSSQIEDVEAETQKETLSIPLKVDSKGLPLAPQPSDHKDDPLVRAQSRSCILR
jgi:hypothetical protein